MDLNFGNNNNAQSNNLGGMNESKSISLRKGQSISLRKGNASINKVLAGLGWKVSDEVGVEFDLDASVFVLNKHGKTINDDYFVFYKNLNSPCGAIEHMGDDRVGGSGDSDDEQVFTTFDKLPQEAERVVFTVTIYDEKNDPSMNFARVSDAYIRIVDDESGKEIARLDLTNQFSFEKSIIIAEFVKTNNGWDFKALEEGVSGDLGIICANYGISANM